LFSLIIIFTWISDIHLSLKISTTLIIFIFFILGIRWIKNKAFHCSFFEDHLSIKYDFQPKEFTVKYTNISEIRYYSVHKGTDSNRIYFTSSPLKKIRIETVAHGDDFVEFIKWIKSKNENIEVAVYPSDHILNHKLQEVYGFKYRKVRNPETD